MVEVGSNIVCNCHLVSGYLLAYGNVVIHELASLGIYLVERAADSNSLDLGLFDVDNEGNLVLQIFFLQLLISFDLSCTLFGLFSPFIFQKICIFTLISLF